jgi:hypothetical protein
MDVPTLGWPTLVWRTLARPTPARPTLPATLLTALVSLSLSGCVATTGRPADPSAELRDLESRRAAALVSADVATLERLRSGALRYERVEPRDVDVRLAGEVALVRGVADVRALGTAGHVDATLAYLGVYARRDGRWQLVAYQSTLR